jgi:hypothetical protein
MPYLIAAPEMMTAAAADLAAIGSNVSAAHMVAAARTTSVVPAAADEVSAAIASVFANHAQAFQGLAGQAAAFNDQFVQSLKSGGAAYAQTEATSAAGLKSLLSPLLSLVPPGIKSDLATALFLSPFLVIAGFVIVYFAFAFLLYFLMHPQQFLQLLLMVLPQQLMTLGL